MKNFAAIAAFAAGANALVPRGNSCCFTLTASGGASGIVGQLDDGQNRIGGDLPPGQFCIESDGSITDGNGRGCILTPPTTQFQCDEGASPSPGFSVNSNGQLEYDGSTHFVACATGQDNELNIYTTESEDVTKCQTVQLNADSCSGSGTGTGSSSGGGQSPTAQPSSTIPTISPSSTGPSVRPTPPCVSSETPGMPVPGESNGVPGPGSPPSQTPTGTLPPQSSQTPQPSSECCQTDLSGDYEFPHLIIPVDSSSPDNAAGTSYNGTVSSTVSTIFNFDIPASDAGRTCSLVFLFPKQEDLETSSFSFSGDGRVSFGALSEPATPSTTYNNAPSISQSLGELTISPGHSYAIHTFACPAGQAVGYAISNAGSTSLDFFEDYNPSPIGLYITKC